jgi:hypothetical protein
MFHVSAVSEAFAQIIYAISSVLGASLCADCLSTLYSSWQKAKMRLEDEKWLRDNCKDPVFFTNLKSYTTVCSEVEANARVGAFWVALHEVTDGMRISWHPWMAGWAACACVGAMFACWIFSPGVHIRRRHEPFAYMKDTLP